jgi:hypothetical protein
MSSSALSVPSIVLSRASRPARSSDLQALQFLSFIAAVFAIAFQLLASTLDDPAPTLNLWIPIAIAGTCAGGAFLLMHTNPLWIWSPLMTMLGAIAIFHGLGPLLHVFGTQSAILYVDQFASINEEELMRTNLLDSWGVTCILVSFTLFFQARRQRAAGGNELRKRSQNRGMQAICWFLVCLALPLKYFVVMPYFLGWMDPDFVLPGFLVVLGNLSLLCLFLFLYYAWSRSSWFYLPAAFVFVMELVTGLLEFNKSEIMTTLGVVFLGLYFVRPSRRLAMVAITAIAIAYSFVTPIASKGRVYLHSNSASLSERLEALSIAWHGDGNAASEPDTQGWWTRLCYANAQAFCLRQYDAGIGGETFQLILPAIIPRVLWPDKPIMTPGFEFNQLVTRNRHSSSAPGVFAEAYWNAGWIGVFVTTAYLGLLCNWFTRVAFRCVAARDVRWLPFGIGGLLMGASITDWFASTYVGGAITYVIYFAAVYLLIPNNQAAGQQVRAR